MSDESDRVQLLADSRVAIVTHLAGHDVPPVRWSEMVSRLRWQVIKLDKENQILRDALALATEETT